MKTYSIVGKSLLKIRPSGCISLVVHPTVISKVKLLWHLVGNETYLLLLLLSHLFAGHMK